MPRLARHSRAGSDGTPKSPTASLQLQLFLSCSCSCCSLLPCWTNHQLHCNHSGQSCPSIFNLRVVRAPFTYLTMAFAVVARELSCFAHRLLVAPITFLSSLVSHDLSHPRPFIGPASLSSRARLNSMQLSSPCLWPETSTASSNCLRFRLFGSQSLHAADHHPPCATGSFCARLGPAGGPAMGCSRTVFFQVPSENKVKCVASLNAHLSRTPAASQGLACLVPFRPYTRITLYMPAKPHHIPITHILYAHSV
ncbi:hypothetical protein V8C43DRAFT_256422 [Trichoderma afarasin]